MFLGWCTSQSNAEGCLLLKGLGETGFFVTQLAASLHTELWKLHRIITIRSLQPLQGKAKGNMVNGTRCHRPRKDVSWDICVGFKALLTKRILWLLGNVLALNSLI